MYHQLMLLLYESTIYLELKDTSSIANCAIGYTLATYCMIIRILLIMQRRPNRVFISLERWTTLVSIQTCLLRFIVNFGQLAGLDVTWHDT